MDFNNYKLDDTLLKNIRDLNFVKPTNIQKLVMGDIIKGMDVVSVAQTGSGKTAAYLIPIINDLIINYENNTQCIIFVPTRDLVNQVYDSFLSLSKNTKLRACRVMGGINKEKQINELRSKPNIIIAVTGRFKEFADKKIINFFSLKYFVLDEFDKMLDMGFRKDILSFIHTLKNAKINYQTLLFSATYNNNIKHLVEQSLKPDFALVKSEEEKTIKELINQKFLVMHKSHMVNELLTTIYNNNKQIIIFVNTINDCNNFENLLRYLGLKVKSINGDRTQSYRDTVIEMFKKKEISILVSTDLLSRGIDIKDLDLLINYSLPESIETYIHRIGRVGRAGNKGKVINICSLSEENKINEIINKHKIHANVIKKDIWMKESKEKIKDIINKYYNNIK